MEMPTIKPIPIPTKGEPTYIQLFRWMFSVRQWELAEDWYYTNNGHKYVVPKGFVFDGASIPRPLWFFLSPTGLLLIPGLIHDFGYRYQYLWELDPNTDCGYKKTSVETYRKYWDELFHEVSKEVNGMKVVSGIAYIALWLFGNFAWKRNRKKNEKELCPTSI